MTNKKVGVVVLNLNQRKLVSEFISELQNQLFRDFNLYLVDNGSQENEKVSDLATQSDNVTHIDTGVNLGFAGGNNVAIRRAINDECEYIWIVNNDVRLEPDCLGRLVEYLDSNTNVGVVSPKIMYESDRQKIWYAGGKINWSKPYPYSVNTHYGEGEIDAGRFEDVRNVDFVTGASMLCRVEALGKASLKDGVGFDERYFAYFEDADLSLRIKKSGYGLVYLPSAKMYHMVGSLSGVVSPRSAYYQIRNSLLFIKEWGPSLSFLRAALNAVVIVSKNLVKLFIPSKHCLAVAQLRAIYDFASRKYYGFML